MRHLLEHFRRLPERLYALRFERREHQSTRSGKEVALLITGDANTTAGDLGVRAERLPLLSSFLLLLLLIL
jgi:hypothetical protein